MVEEVQGNLLEADVEALVNTVNTVGVMGKGIALQFRQQFPENYEVYRRAYRQGELEPGRVLLVPVKMLEERRTRFVINFPTKRHWRGNARLDDIEAGLRDLVEVIRREGIRSVAVPPLGCGNGGLDWGDVRPRILEAFRALPEVTVLLFQPAGAPAAEEMKVRTKRPRWTLLRAGLVALMDSYSLPEYRLSLLEVQKLAYLFQTAGADLRLRYEKQAYGPYAEKLNPALQHVEGHFIRGYGDRTGNESIHVLPDAVEEAAAYLRARPDTLDQIRRVRELIEGFETPYGMELLATVHWVAQEDESAARDPYAAIEAIQNWSERKHRAFLPEHIVKVWSRLRSLGWIPADAAESG